jgi:hypothetical protein
MNGSDLQIGEIAALSGVSVDTVRYYEKLKLLPRAAATLTRATNILLRGDVQPTQKHQFSVRYLREKSP